VAAANFHSRLKQMKVFVINLKRRPDRLEHVRKALPPAWLTAAEFTTGWPGPVDGSTITGGDTLREAGISLYDGWKLPDSNNAWWNRPLKLGEIGCSFSHLSVWRRAHQAFEQDPTLKYVVVLEDDIRCDPTVPEKVERTIEQLGAWDVLYLGRVLQQGYDDHPVTDVTAGVECAEGAAEVVEPGFSYCLYGYVLSRSGVQRILAADFHESIIPVDEFIPACYTMHPRRDISQLFPPVLRAFAVEPHLVFQLTKCEGGSDTEASKVWKQ